MGPKSNSESMEILFQNTSGPSCCSSHGLPGGPEMPTKPPGCSRGAKVVSQNVKMETPRRPNDNPEKPKGADGRGCSLNKTRNTTKYKDKCKRMKKIIQHTMMLPSEVPKHRLPHIINGPELTKIAPCSTPHCPLPHCPRSLILGIVE